MKRGKKRTVSAGRVGGQREHDQLVRSIVELAGLYGLVALVLEAKPVRVCAPSGRMYYVSRVDAGVPDVLVLIPPLGRAFFVEVKTGRAKMRAAQVERCNMLRRAGAQVMVCSDINDFDREIKRLVSVCSDWSWGRQKPPETGVESDFRAGG
ncbi:MAG: VRR-NUC domain-containing protein [Candidatus Sumerlaeaceae bacterium]|nr:VRR-NUC domain-containing protein [Candidatus Sumerlaeaceae bacterium]